MSEQQKIPSTSADLLRELLSIKGIPERSQANELSHILEIPFSAANKILKGTTPLEAKQRMVLANFLDVDEQDLLEANRNDEDAVGSPQPALFIIGEKELPAQLWLGALLAPGDAKPQYVAIEGDNRWDVVDATSAPDVPQFIVEKLELRFEKPKGPLIAVIDDDEILSASLAEGLEMHGFTARAFSDPQAFVNTLGTTRWDGIVLDWTLGDDWNGSRVMTLIESSSSASAPLLLLTGILNDGSAAGTGQVAKALEEKPMAIFLSKPLDISIVASTLRKRIWQKPA